MSDNNAIISKAVFADEIITEYSGQVKEFEEKLRSEIDNMYRVLNGLFSSWTGELAEAYHEKINNNLTELTSTCNRTRKLSEVLERRARQMRDMLEKLKKAGSNG